MASERFPGLTVNMPEHIRLELAICAPEVTSEMWVEPLRERLQLAMRCLSQKSYGGLDIELQARQYLVEALEMLPEAGGE
jgi:hypothetical protein